MFRTLGDLNKDDSKGDKKTTESYTGGEKSGMAVENPDDINGIVAKAKEGSEKSKNRDDKDKPDVEIRITLYANGFTIENGELREYDTPENKEFMKELNEGYIPKELRAKYNKPIGIALEDRRKEKKRLPTPPKYVAYSGEGVSMGGTAGVGGAVDKNAAGGKPQVDESAPKTTI